MITRIPRRLCRNASLQKISRYCEGQDDCHFVDNMGEKTDSVRKKLAFLEIEDHASFVESATDRLDVTFVFFWGFAVDEDVVEVDNAEFMDVGL